VLWMVVIIANNCICVKGKPFTKCLYTQNLNNELNFAAVYQILALKNHYTDYKRKQLVILVATNKDEKPRKKLLKSRKKSFNIGKNSIQ